MSGSDRVPPKRVLSVDLAYLEFAFENASPEVSSYLDLETGEVVTVTDEIRRELDEIGAEIWPDDGEAEADPAALEAELKRRDLHDWMQDAILEAASVEAGFGTRYIAVPEADSREAYRDMEAFIETIADTRLQNRLWDSIRGRGAFRRFKDVLATRDPELQLWYAFKNARVRERILEWLAAEGIEPSLDSG